MPLSRRNFLNAVGTTVAGVAVAQTTLTRSVSAQTPLGRAVVAGARSLGVGSAATSTVSAGGSSATTALSNTYPQTYGDWANGLLAGNGKQAIIVFGDPRDDTVVFDDRAFFMARTEAHPTRTFNTVSQANLDKIRGDLIAGDYTDANQLAANVQGWQDGGEGTKHPGFMMTIQLPDAGPVTNYVRSTDYAAGVVAVNWTDDKGDWERTSFVSRTDGVTVQYLAAPTGQTEDVTLGLSIDPGMHLLTKGLTPTDNSSIDFLNIRVKYASGSFNAGYEGVTRIITDGARAMSGSNVTVTGASYVMLLSLTQRYNGTYDGGVPAEQEWTKNLLQTQLSAIMDDYQSLLSRHVTGHQQIFSRMAIDFGADPADRAKSTEELFTEQQTSTTPTLALFERMFYAGRFHLLASSFATAAPDLLGNWTGDSDVGWSGYYHLDANLNLQISSGNISDMPEAMAGYFYLNQQWQKDFETNAQKLLGTRGMLTGGNTPNGEGLISALSYDYPYQYVSGGESWLLYPFWEYYQITGDQQFLADKYYPLIRDMGDFYQDFLVDKDADGKYILAGSISPENTPGSNPPLAINSVYDISGAKFALSTLIQTSKTLGKDAAMIPVWQELLDNLPPYLINNDGALAEYASPDLENKNNYQHRHSSGLMPVWPYREITPEASPALYDAARVFLAKKDQGTYENAGHGLLHGALIAAGLNVPDSVGAKLLRFVKDGYYFNGMGTSHYNGHNTFCTDVANSVPTIMMQMLATTSPGTLELLPALPAGLDKGSISGILGKSQFTIDKLSWDRTTRQVQVTVTSKIDQDLTLIQRDGIEQISSDDVTVNDSALGGIARVLPLSKGVATTVNLVLVDVSRVNLALNQPAVASSENPGQTAAMAFDGDPSSRWSASQDPANWLQVDLGGYYDLSEVDIQWEASYAKSYKIQISSDDKTWTDAHTQTNSSGGAEKIPLTGFARYVRMQGVALSGQWGYSIYEMQVYGQDAPDIAQGKPALASSASNPDQDAWAAFDGDMSTRWSASQDPANWLQVDLGASYDVNRVAIEWEDSYAKGYKIQTSPDGQAWTDAFVQIAGDGGEDLIDLDTTTRYVRMQGTALSGQWGYSIYEMRVYGTPVIIVPSALTATTPPAVTGTSQVGVVVTASQGTWSATPATVTYQWSADGQDIDGATAASYTPVAEDLGKHLAVTVTATAAGYDPGVATSEATAAVINGDAPTATTPPAVTGTPKVGVQLTADPGTWSIASGLTFSYIWKAGGAAIAGAILPTYIPGIGDVGKQLTVVVTAVVDGYDPGTATSTPTAAVVAATVPPPPALTVTVKPAICGTPKVGVAALASSGSWSVATGLTYSYQWTIGGRSINGATKSSYTPLPTDASKALAVIVTAKKAGYANATATSATKTVAAGSAPHATKAPTISGSPVGVGHRLTATSGSWSLSGLRFGYQWLADGHAIKGATQSSYTPVVTDLGKHLAVRVTATRAGYATGTATSAAKPVVKGSAPHATTPPKIAGSPVGVGHRLTAEPGSWSLSGLKFGYQWLADGHAIRGATHANYTPDGADVGKHLAVRVTATRTGYANGTATSAAKPVAKGSAPHATKPPKISGSLGVGHRLTATSGSWPLSSLRFGYQWLANGHPIKGATRSSFTPLAADVSKRLAVRVTATRAGYANGTATSAPTAKIPR